MNLPDLIWTNSSTRDDELFEIDEIYQKRPFSLDYPDDSSDSEQIELLDYENPFSENAYIFNKHKSIKFKTRQKTPRHNSPTWSKCIYSKQRYNTLIRSASTSIEGTYRETNSNGERTTLPTLGCGVSDSIKRISPNTVGVLLSGTLKRNFMIIDARFTYEYQGGHVINALNYRSEIELMKNLERNAHKPDILIFYCEFSSERAPLLAKNFRNADRNKNRYPELLFPEIYILEGGYKAFFKSHSHLCIPNAYIQMSDKRFKKECIEQHKKIKIKKI